LAEQGRSFDLIIDIGANLGYFSKYAAELFPKATIIAIEPTLESFQYLVKNLMGLPIVCLEIGVGDGLNHMLNIISDNPGANFLADNGSLVVKTTTLIQLVTHMPIKSLIKFDCEDCEYFMLLPDNFKILLKAQYICGEFHHAHSHKEFMQKFKESFDIYGLLDEDQFIFKAIKKKSCIALL
jgi:FkbM family methyltransferase